MVAPATGGCGGSYLAVLVDHSSSLWSGFFVGSSGQQCEGGGSGKRDELLIKS